MACLKESALQGYLEEFEPSPLRQTVESRLASCARCRAAFDRVVARNRRVNSWLSKLSRADSAAVDAREALARVLGRVEASSPPELSFGRGTDPRALTLSVILQSAIVAVLMLAGTTQIVRAPATQITLIAPPPVVRPAQVRASRGGGGGQRSPLPPPKGPLSKPAPRVFTPPLVTIEHPALVVEDSLVAPTDAWAAPNGPVGNPLGMFSGGGGRGDSGVGDGPGPGNTIGSGFGGPDGGVFTYGNGVTRPEVITQVEPEYSEEARKAKYSGTVMLSIVVNADGRATDMKVVKSLGMGLDEKALEAVQKWRFRPGTNRGKAVPVRAQVEVNFRLL